MWYWAVPAAYHAEASSPLIVRQGYRAPVVADLLRAAARGAEHPDAELERLPGPLGVRVDEERQDVDLGVPEVMAFVAVAGDALGRHAEAFAARRRLQQLEEVEAHRPLEVGRAFDPDVAAAPEVRHAAGVRELDALVAGTAGAVERTVGAQQQIARAAPAAQW